MRVSFLSSKRQTLNSKRKIFDFFLHISKKYTTFVPELRFNNIYEPERKV